MNCVGLKYVNHMLDQVFPDLQDHINEIILDDARESYINDEYPDSDSDTSAEDEDEVSKGRIWIDLEQMETSINDVDIWDRLERGWVSEKSVYASTEIRNRFMDVITTSVLNNPRKVFDLYVRDDRKMLSMLVGEKVDKLISTMSEATIDEGFYCGSGDAPVQMGNIILDYIKYCQYSNYYEWTLERNYWNVVLEEVNEIIAKSEKGIKRTGDVCIERQLTKFQAAWRRYVSTRNFIKEFNEKNFGGCGF